MKSTYNITGFAAGFLQSNGPVYSGSLAGVLPGATMTAYTGKQPSTAAAALGERGPNVAAAVWTFPFYCYTVLNTKRIIFLDVLADTIWKVSGKVHFVRVARPAPYLDVLFDASIDSLETQILYCNNDYLTHNPDLIIVHNPVRAGDLAHVTLGSQAALTSPFQMVTEAR